MFQSSPARGGGCNTPFCGRRPVSADPSFNPHPPVRAGATCQSRLATAVYRVSILTRPWGRVQRNRARRAAVRDPCFNPHPPVGAGATVCSGGGLGDAIDVSILTRPWGRVQLDIPKRGEVVHIVSILTRPWGRVQQRQARARCAVLGVSILTRPWGRVQPEEPFE